MMTINTVCLCGSTRFADEYAEANRELAKRGLSVITISMALEKDAAGTDNGLKEMLDLVHLNKILRADAILIVGDGYIGRSTAREILWADMQGKVVHTQYDHTEKGEVTAWDSVAECIKCNDPIDEYDVLRYARKRLEELA